MAFTFNGFFPDYSKLYTIQYNNKSYKNTHNAIFGRANKPYHFGFFKTGESNYILVRYEDGKVLCIGEEGLEMRSSNKGIKPAIVNFIEVQKGTYALSVQSQGKQKKYIGYDGYVMHEYYVGLEASNSIIDFGIWIIKEAPDMDFPIPEISNNNDKPLKIQTYLLGFTSKMDLEPSLN